MDLLSQRYANPYLILDDVIRLGQLHEFTLETMRTIAQDNIQKSRWEYYLHKVWDMSFEDYVAACEKKEPEEKTISKEEAIRIIQASNSILEDFTLN